jgi:hypothetical protein
VGAPADLAGAGDRGPQARSPRGKRWRIQPEHLGELRRAQVTVGVQRGAQPCRDVPNLGIVGRTDIWVRPYPVSVAPSITQVKPLVTTPITDSTRLTALGGLYETALRIAKKGLEEESCRRYTARLRVI